jgi:hypothetical protein
MDEMKILVRSLRKRPLPQVISSIPTVLARKRRRAAWLVFFPRRAVDLRTRWNNGFVDLGDYVISCNDLKRRVRAPAGARADFKSFVEFKMKKSGGLT